MFIQCLFYIDAESIVVMLRIVTVIIIVNTHITLYV